MTKIYMLYDHEEHGPENYAVTDNVSDLTRLFDELWPRRDWDARGESLEKLAALIMKEHVGTGKFGTFSLCDGWGGPHLLIAEIGGVYGEAWREAEVEAYRARIGWKPPVGA